MDCLRLARTVVELLLGQSWGLVERSETLANLPICQDLPVPNRLGLARFGSASPPDSTIKSSFASLLPSTVYAPLMQTGNGIVSANTCQTAVCTQPPLSIFC